MWANALKGSVKIVDNFNGGSSVDKQGSYALVLQVLNAKYPQVFVDNISHFLCQALILSRIQQKLLQLA